MSGGILCHAVIRPQSSDDIYSVLAFRDGVITYVGHDTEKAAAAAGPDARVIDAGGRTVIPCFVDSHTHPSCVALTDWHVMLKGSTAQELLESAADFCRTHSPAEVPYLFGESYDASMFGPEGPRRELLDRYVSDRPFRLQDFTDHSCCYNSKALELMGIRKGEPDPPETPANAVIVRDPDGTPTGWMLEVFDALDRRLFDAVGWEPELAPTERNMTPFLDFMTRHGVGTVMDAMMTEESARLFRRMEAAGSLRFFYDGCVLLPTYDSLDETIAEARRMRAVYGSDRIRIHTVKFFLDGTNELGDMASLEPLRTDETGQNFGHINMTEDELTDTMVRLNEAGFDLHMHVVGDRAFRTACNAMECAKAICGDAWRIYITSAHCELVHPDDRERPAALGMFVNWSCHWAGGYFGEKSRDYLGKDRFDTMYDFTGMLAAGVKLAFSSDVFSYKEANRADPFFGIQCSATRVDPEFPLPEERFPGHVRTPADACLPVDALIKGYTYTAACQLRLEDRVGSLETGRDASFLVLSDDPYTAEPFNLSRIHPSLVYLNGEPAFTEEM